QDSQRREPRRTAGSAAVAVRVRPQHENRTNARPHRAADAPRTGRRGDRVRRRAFITMLGGAAAWPLTVRAEQRGKMPTVGYLWQAGGPQEEVPYFGALLEGFANLGFRHLTRVRSRKSARRSMPW